jgi:hypothetical protein
MSSEARAKVRKISNQTMSDHSLSGTGQSRERLLKAGRFLPDEDIVGLREIFCRMSNLCKSAHPKKLTMGGIAALVLIAFSACGESNGAKEKIVISPTEFEVFGYTLGDNIDDAYRDFEKRASKGKKYRLLLINENSFSVYYENIGIFDEEFFKFYCNKDRKIDTIRTQPGRISGFDYNEMFDKLKKERGMQAYKVYYDDPIKRYLTDKYSLKFTKDSYYLGPNYMLEFDSHSGDIMVRLLTDDIRSIYYKE